MTKFLNNLKIREKNLIIIIVSIFIPMLITNIFFFKNIDEENRDKSMMEMENSADRTEYALNNSIRELISIADYIDRMKIVNEFLTGNYENSSDYYRAYNEFMETEAIQYYYSAQSTEGITIFTENPTILNGRYFVNKELIEERDWYKRLNESGKDYLVYTFFENGDLSGYLRKGRHFTVVKKLNYFGGNDCIMLDLNYSDLQKEMMLASAGKEAYLTDAEGNILLTSDGADIINRPYEQLEKVRSGSPVLERDFDLFGTNFGLYMRDTGKSWIEVPGEKSFMLIALYIFDLILPAIILYIIFRSMNERLYRIGVNIESVKNDIYEEIITEPSGDEIGEIIQSYNHMVARIRELIETVYKNKEREQELLISKKDAELHALQSQINPHFMFNALESIRMHSLIKNEKETAEILEDFAMLLRENIRWDTDMVTVGEECRNAERYLEIQKYRFGERLEYTVRVETGCEKLVIPKFSIINFVENACVHGIENSVDGGEITVLVSSDGEMVYIEVLDSGSGMTGTRLDELKKTVENADISYIESKDRSIGIANTVVRLKQIYEEKVFIDIKSAESGGTEVCIVIPVMSDDRVKRNETDDSR